MFFSRLHRSQIFQLCLIAILLGLVLGSLLDSWSSRYAALLGASFSVAIISIGWGRKSAIVVGLLLLGISGGLWRSQSSLQAANSSAMQSYNGGSAIVWQGVIVQEPDVRDTKIYYTLQPRTIADQEVGANTGLVLVTLGRYPEYHYGDLLSIRGKLATPFETKDFSYRSYLAKDGIYSVSQYPSVEIVAHDQGNFIKAKLLNLKQYFAESLGKILSEPHNSLLLGLLLGLKRALPQDFSEQLKITGLTHIVAISGFNISIITRILGEALRKWFGRRASFILTFAALSGFVVITGATASVIRAAIMGTVVLLALNIGRRSSMSGALLLAAVGMVWISPGILFFDLGFQLSFLATLGLVTFAEKLEQMIQAVPTVLELRTTLAATLAAQLFVWPVLLYNFDQLSLISPLANLLILPIIPALMFVGCIAGVLAMVHPVLALLPAWIAWIMLQYMLSGIAWLARIPGASISPGHPPMYWLVLYYIFLSLVGVWVMHRKRRKIKEEFFGTTDVLST